MKGTPMHLICECKTVYAVGAPACPQCGSTKATPDHPTPGFSVVAGQVVADEPAVETPVAAEEKATK